MNKSKCILLVFMCLCLSLKSQNWSPMGSGLNNDVVSLYRDTVTDLLYVGGSFRYANGINASGIASWDGDSWDTLQCGLDNYPPLGSDPGYPSAMCNYNGTLYVGGQFYQGGTVSSPVIAKWDGSAWASFSSGFNGAIIDMMEYNDELYVCGQFDSVAGISANGIAKWNGSSWSSVNLLPNYNIAISGKNYIYSMAVFQGNIYVAGSFEGSSGYKEITYWDGVQWQPLALGIYGSDAEVASMAVYQNELYVAGIIKTSAGNIGNYIQRWNGTVWSDVGGGVAGIASGSGQIHDLKVIDNKLYAVGVFSFAGGIPAQYIASWDGIDWCAYGSIFDNRIVCIESYNNEIYIGGGFWTIDGDTVNRIAKWVGATFVDTCGNLTGISETNTNTLDFSIYPNPTNSSITLAFETNSEKASFSIMNYSGQIVMKSEDLKTTKGKNEFKIDLNSLSNGIYLIHLKTGSSITSKKIIKN